MYSTFVFDMKVNVTQIVKGIVDISTILILKILIQLNRTGLNSTIVFNCSG